MIYNVFTDVLSVFGAKLFFMAALRSRWRHYIFVLFLPFFLLLLFGFFLA